jgi:hypothetical protein
MMTPGELERWIDRKLNALPLPEAPPTLVPRVLESIRRHEAVPWYGRGWSRWPRHWQVLSLATAAGLVVAGVWIGPAIQDGLLRIWSPIQGNAVAPIVGLGRGAAALAGVVAPLWRAFVAPLWGYLFLISLMTGTSCAVLAAVLNRVTLGGEARS